MGIYNVDTDMQPTSLVTDFGAIDSSTTGVKTASGTASLTPGWYASCIVANGAPTVRWYSMSGLSPGLQPAMGGSPVIALISIALTYGALPSTATAWTTFVAGNGPLQHHCIMRWTP
jgi:hypothetical protein